jgi:DNA-binding NarL/FixJ family response regulator
VPKGHPYRVLIVEDQDTYMSEDSTIELFRRDRGEDSNDPYLELAGRAENFGDAIQVLEEMAPELPDAIVIDDRLPEGSTTQSRSVEIMRWLFDYCEGKEVPLADRPRAVLWTADDDPQLAYTFCVLGGMQFRAKAELDGAKLPVDAIWAALAGHRWCPEPYPEGLSSSGQRAALPWLEAGWMQETILGEPQLKREGVSVNTLRYAFEKIQAMPHTPQEPSPSYPDNWPMAVHAAKRNGWVWVPLDRHDQIPSNAPLPLVIDPKVHRQGLPPYGPLPARIS